MKCKGTRDWTIIEMPYFSVLFFFLLLHPINGLLDFSNTPIRQAIFPVASSSTRYDMTVVDSTNDSTLPTHQPAEADSIDPRNSHRRSLRRKIPYVESFEEQISRELWEKHPFRGAEHVVDAIIGSGSNNFDPGFQTVLTRIKIESEKISSLSGYEDSFDLLYKHTEDTVVPSISESDDSICTTSGVMGVASITASPFAKIVDDHETRKEKLKNFCLRVAYRGNDFCGWQTQLDNTEQRSVQRTLEEWLTELQNDQVFNVEANVEAKRARRAEKRDRISEKSTAEGKTKTHASDNSIHHEMVTRKENGKKECQKFRWADLPVAGRTDSGVSAIGQLCRFRTHRKDLTPKSISDFLDTKIQNTTDVSHSLRVTQVTPVTKAFHPTFTTSCRAYAYLIDIDSANAPSKLGLLGHDQAQAQVVLMDAMLQYLQGKTLDYVGLSYGRVKTSNTLCTLHHARARLVEYPGVTIRRSICIELVGDRFLRRMVRLLVEAAVRLVATQSQQATTNLDNHSNAESALLRLIEQQDRTLVGRPSPPDGLIFVAARVQSHV